MAAGSVVEGVVAAQQQGLVGLGADAPALLADVDAVAHDDGLAGALHPAGEHLHVAGGVDDLGRRLLGDGLLHPAEVLVVDQVVAAQALPVVALQPERVRRDHLRHDGGQVAGGEAAALHGLDDELARRDGAQAGDNARAGAAAQDLLHEGELEGARVVLVEVGLHLDGRAHLLPGRLVRAEGEQLPHAGEVAVEALPQPPGPGRPQRLGGELVAEEAADDGVPAGDLRPVGEVAAPRLGGGDDEVLGVRVDGRVPGCLLRVDAVDGAPGLLRDAAVGPDDGAQAVPGHPVQDGVELVEALGHRLQAVEGVAGGHEEAEGVDAQRVHGLEIAVHEGQVVLEVPAQPVRAAGAGAAAEVDGRVEEVGTPVEGEVAVAVGGDEGSHARVSSSVDGRDDTTGRPGLATAYRAPAPWNGRAVASGRAWC